MSNINIELPDELHKQAKIKAIILNMDLKDYITTAIEEKNAKKWLEKGGLNKR